MSEMETRSINDAFIEQDFGQVPILDHVDEGKLAPASMDFVRLDFIKSWVGWFVKINEA